MKTLGVWFLIAGLGALYVNAFDAGDADSRKPGWLFALIGIFFLVLP